MRGDLRSLDRGLRRMGNSGEAPGLQGEPQPDFVLLGLSTSTGALPGQVT